MPRLNGKFVSQAKYDAAMAAGKKEVVTEEAPEKKPRKPRTTDPITQATVRVRRAKKELDRVKAALAKRKPLPSLEDAQAEYDNAVSALNDALNS